VRTFFYITSFSDGRFCELIINCVHLNLEIIEFVSNEWNDSMLAICDRKIERTIVIYRMTLRGEVFHLPLVIPGTAPVRVVSSPSD